jgi:N-acetylmuramoyl-L-alanine amidase
MEPFSRRSGLAATVWSAGLIAALFILLVLTSLPSSAAEWFRWGSAVPEATAARLGGNEFRTRFVADVTVPVNFNAYVLSDPYRVIIDLQEVEFALSPGSGRQGRGLVSAFRYGLIDSGRSRIVIDAKGPVLIDRAFIIEPENGEPARLVVDIVPTDEKTFTRLNRPQQPEPGPALPLPLDGEEVPEELPPLGAKARVQASNPPAGRFTIVIDPGHGGIDPGAIGKNGTTEKSIVLAFAKELERRLDRRRYDVILTRTGDSFLSLKERVRIARKNRADLFLALHADVVRGAAVRGATVYTLSDMASDAEAEALAHAENRADLIAGVDLAEESEEITGILIDLALRETKNHSLVFARTMVDSLDPVIEMTGRPLRSAGFLVLKAPDVPSALLELGYLSSQADEKLLNSQKWRAKTAGAVIRAIDNFFAARMAANH